MSAILERSFCAQLPHRQRFSQDVQRALALLDRVADGAPVNSASVEVALRVTGDLDDLWLSRFNDKVPGDAE